MFSIITLILTMTSANVDSVKVETISNDSASKLIHTFHREGRMILPSAPVVVALATKGETAPESYTTCYQNSASSCWSETSTEYFKGF